MKSFSVACDSSTKFSCQKQLNATHVRRTKGRYAAVRPRLLTQPLNGIKLVLPFIEHRLKRAFGIEGPSSILVDDCVPMLIGGIRVELTYGGRS